MWKRDWPANTTSPGLLVSFARLRRNRAIRRLAASCFRGTTLVGLGCRVDRRTIVMTNGGPASGQTFSVPPVQGKPSLTNNHHIEPGLLHVKAIIGASKKAASTFFCLVLLVSSPYPNCLPAISLISFPCL